MSDIEIASFKLNGFVALRDFLTDDELEHWRRVVRTVAGPAASGSHGTTNRSNLSGRYPALAALWRDEMIGALVGALSGSEGVRHLNDQISYVLPGQGATPWHCGIHDDWPVDTANAIALYVPLDELRWNNKAPSFLPGSHEIMPVGARSVGAASLRNATFASLLDEYPALRTIEPVTVEGPAGMLVIYNPLGVHGSAPNMTRRVRRTAIATYVRAGEVSNGLPSASDRTVDEYRLRAGQPLTDDEAPLIWTATTSAGDRSGFVSPAGTTEVAHQPSGGRTPPSSRL